MKKILTLYVEETVVNQAKSLGLNISRFLQTKLIDFIQLNSVESVKFSGLSTVSGGYRARSKVADLGSQIDFQANEQGYIRWLKTKGLNKVYQRDLLNYAKKYLTFPINNENQLVDILSKHNNHSLRIAIRSFLNFLAESNLIDEEVANRYRKVLKDKHRSNVDNFIPDDTRVLEAYNNLTSERERVIFSVLAYSGIRQTEAMKLLNEWDSSRLIINNTIAKYPLNWTRGQKKIYYVYLPKLFALSLHKFYSTRKMLEITGKKGGLNLKYLRKWQYNFLIINGTPEGVADFIQGRSPETVGSMHYLGKVKQADYWYEKVVDKMGDMFKNEQNTSKIDST